MFEEGGRGNKACYKSSSKGVLNRIKEGCKKFGWFGFSVYQLACQAMIPIRMAKMTIPMQAKINFFFRALFWKTKRKRGENKTLKRVLDKHKKQTHKNRTGYKIIDGTTEK